ncbi:hypothetical protein Dimus_038444 [Dionaea muscipula]
MKEIVLKQGWLDLFECSDLVYPLVVRRFYENLHVEKILGDLWRFSKVHGVTIEMTAKSLGKILGIPNKGYSRYEKGIWEPSKHCIPLRALQRFSTKENPELLKPVLVQDMQPFSRLLHLVVIKNLVPRAGKRSEAGFLDLALMEHLIKGKKVNLPKLMIQHISHAVNQANHGLPYGMCLTKVLKHFQVPLCAKEKNIKMDHFGESFLRKNELEIVEGVWWLGKRKARRRDAPLNSEAPEDPIVPEDFEVPTQNAQEGVAAVSLPRTDSLPAELKAAQSAEIAELKRELALAQGVIEELHRNQAVPDPPPITLDDSLYDTSSPSRGTANSPPNPTTSSPPNVAFSTLPATTSTATHASHATVTIPTVAGPSNVDDISQLPSVRDFDSLPEKECAYETSNYKERLNEIKTTSDQQQ